MILSNKKTISFYFLVQTAVAANPNADDIRVPMAISQATAFTILSTESLLAYQNHSPSTGLAARQEEGLRALLRLVISMESIVTSQEVTHFFIHFFMS